MLYNLLEKQTILDFDSTNLSKAVYTHKTKVLFVEFANGQIYQYYNVPYFVIKNWEKAESNGQYFNKHIRGVKEYEKVL